MNCIFIYLIDGVIYFNFFFFFSCNLPKIFLNNLFNILGSNREPQTSTPLKTSCNSEFNFIKHESMVSHNITDNNNTTTHVYNNKCEKQKSTR